MRARQLNVSAVLVGDRYRRDLGDLKPLMRSMDREGQRQPILLLDNHELLAGERRLEAARQLGWSTITAGTVRGFAEAVEALKADWASASDVEHCLIMRPSERVAQVELLRGLYARERKMPPPGTTRADRWAYQVDPILADVLGHGMTNYRMIRLAVLTASGRRPYTGRPVTDLDRVLAQRAVDQIDGGMSIDGVGTRLRAQLGYPRNSRIPKLLTDPDRLPDKALRLTRTTTKAGRRPPLLDQLNVVATQFQAVAKKLDKITSDDRWPANRNHVQPAVRLTLQEAADRLAKALQQIPEPTDPKDTTS